MKPQNPIHPGEILLEEFLVPMNVSQRQFARKLGWTTAKLNELVNGKRGITADSALDLADALGTSPEVWMNLQMMWDLNKAEEETKGVVETNTSSRTTLLTPLSDFDYELPQELIAQAPATERDGSRLLDLSPDGSIGHHTFRDLPRLLQPGDLLVLNDTRVFPARLEGVRAGGGRSEFLLLERLDSERWRVLAKPARKLRKGARLSFGGGRLEAEVLEVEDDGKRIVGFRFEGNWDALLEELGTTPLPPYIEVSEDEPATRLRYQTIYARPTGSIAAPTAGLHFTETMFEALRARGVDVAFVTLHVGHATFQPIREDDIEAHRMGVERYLVPEETKEKIRVAERRVVAVGTTTVRALESAARADFPQGWQETDLFITPGFEFRVVSGLLTNFHLPKSSLLILVSAFGGRERVLGAYREAVRERYRFYSFGDAMLLYPARVP